MAKTETQEVARIPHPTTFRRLSNALAAEETRYFNQDVELEVDGEELVIKATVRVAEEDQDPKAASNVDGSGNFVKRPDSGLGNASALPGAEDAQPTISAVTGEVVTDEPKPEPEPTRRERREAKA